MGRYRRSVRTRAPCACRRPWPAEDSTEPAMTLAPPPQRQDVGRQSTSSPPRSTTLPGGSACRSRRCQRSSGGTCPAPMPISSMKRRSPLAAAASARARELQERYHRASLEGGDARAILQELIGDLGEDVEVGLRVDGGLVGQVPELQGLGADVDRSATVVVGCRSGAVDRLAAGVVRTRRCGGPVRHRAVSSPRMPGRG